MDYSGYFSENRVPFARGARCNVSQIGHAQSSCVGVLKGAGDGGFGCWGVAGMGTAVPVKCCSLLDGDGGTGGVSLVCPKED